MTKRFRKNVPTAMTFGGDINYNEGTQGTMIPLAIIGEWILNKKQSIVRFGYGANDNRTIDLVIDNDEIDFVTFN